MDPQQTTRPRHEASLLTPGRPEGTRHQQKLGTLAALRGAALRLALEQGVEETTVGEIAAEAGVSRRTFFNYFATKEDALVGESPLPAAFLREAIAARPVDESPLAAVHAALCHTVATFVTDDVRERVRGRHRLLAAHPELLGRHLARFVAFEHLLVDAITDRGDPGMDPGLLAAMVASATRLCVRRWAENGEPTLIEHLDTALTALRHGLR